MSTDTAPPPARRTALRSASPQQLAWLRGELDVWVRERVVAPEQSAALLARYHASRRLSVGRLLLLLGAGFVGVGVIWLVAANLEQLSPLGRFVLVGSAWLAVLAGGEALAARLDRSGAGSPVLVLAVRTLATLMLGALVFQAAQSLQVPAWEPSLLGWWAAGALVHAYAVRSPGPLLVGVMTGLVWFVWAVLDSAPSGLSVVLALLAGAAVAVGVSALHTRVLTGFADLWRESGALLALAGLFAAALPFVTLDDVVWSRWLVLGLVAAVLATAAGTAVARGRDRIEPLATVAVAALALLLVVWDTGTDTERLATGDWLHAVVSVAVYVVVAVGVAVLGTLRDSRALTATATLALVVFTTFQSFAVFAQIIEGAWLFVVLGLVFLGTGVLFDRARRRLADAIEGTTEDTGVRS